MPQLVIKLYNDKPSRIGVQFVYEFLAVKPYEKMVSGQGANEYAAIMELVRGKIQLTLRSESNGARIEYKELEFKTDQLIRLKALYNDEMRLEFVHVYPKENRLFVAKPFHQERFIRLTSLNFIGMET